MRNKIVVIFCSNVFNIVTVERVEGPFTHVWDGSDPEEKKLVFDDSDPKTQTVFFCKRPEKL